MKVILKENVENLGNKGDVVSVAAGYGRNYLIPKKLAVEVTSTNVKMIEMEQAALKKSLEKARLSYQDVIQRLESTSLSFVRKTAEKDVIFGSVSVTDIKEELDRLGLVIEKKKILLDEPIKRLGNYTIPVKVFLDDKAEIRVRVISEDEAAKPLEKEGPETQEEESKTDSTLQGEGSDSAQVEVDAGAKKEEQASETRVEEGSSPDREKDETSQ